MHLVRDALPRPPDRARTMTEPRPVRLLVCGTADRGDDGAALAAVAHLLPGLPAHLLSTIDVRRCEQLDIEDLLDVPDGGGCVIVDAVVGAGVGEVVTIPLEELPAADGRTGIASRSSHALSIGQLVELAGVLRGTPPRGTFVGLGGRSFGYGRGLGRQVRAALPAFGAAIERELIRHATQAEPRT
jgi:hydrogenase maturation protease